MLGPFAVGLHPADQHGVDADPAARVRPALGPPTQAVPDHLGAGRNPAEFRGVDQAADGVDVEVPSNSRS